VGISSGASVAAALRLSRDSACRDMVIVAMLCDSGERYLSVEGLFDGDSGGQNEPTHPPSETPNE